MANGNNDLIKLNGKITINTQVWRWVERVGWLATLLVGLMVSMSAHNKKDAMIELSIPALEKVVDELKTDFNDEKTKNELRWEKRIKRDARIDAYLDLDTQQ